VSTCYPTPPTYPFGSCCINMPPNKRGGGWSLNRTRNLAPRQKLIDRVGGREKPSIISAERSTLRAGAGWLGGAGEEEMAPGSLERSLRGRGPPTQGSSDGVSEDGGVKLKRESRPGPVSQKQLGIRGRGPSRHPQARDWLEILVDKAGESPPERGKVRDDGSHEQRSRCPNARQAQDKRTGHINGTTPLLTATKENNPLLFQRRRNDVPTTCAFKPGRPGEGCVVGSDRLRISPISKGQDQREDLYVPVPTSSALLLFSFG